MLTKVVSKVKHVVLRPDFDNFAPEKSLTQKNTFCANILVLIPQKQGCEEISVSKITNKPQPNEH